MDDITSEYLHEALSLEEPKGVLRWKVRPRSHFKTDAEWKSFNTRLAGKVAGSVCCKLGRLVRAIGFNDRAILAHRIVYAMHHGVSISNVPSMLDHKDGDSENNSPSNIRPCTYSQNLMNAFRRKGKKLPKGVALDKRDGVYFSTIWVDKKRYHLGRFKNVDDAVAAYAAASIRYHGEFSRVD